MAALPATEAFVALLGAARCGSLSAAAEELGLTHGAVSRRIHAVERWLGAPAFERHGRGVRLTPLGAALVRRTERSLGALADFASSGRMPREVATVRVSVLPSFARLWLMPRLVALQGSPIDLTVQFVTEHRMTRLDLREADLAIRVGTGGWTGVAAERLLDEVIVPVATPAIARAVGDSPARIADHPLLHDTDTRDWRDWMAVAGLDYRRDQRDRHFEDYDLLVAGARAGLGIALARLPFAQAAITEAGLVTLPGPAAPRERGFWIVRRPGEARTHVMRLVERLHCLGNAHRQEG
ncbi:MAG: LysR substrate-binding domain-containing protein [Pseudomonadota bacterium]|uniref:LysR substrate-binding domain-containing protein n=1 Tax=Sphingomonas sp. ERG5 TaxID=1381597 RepID=UPI0006925294|nr:LysR substrate-binding domain-containing protein [Sphingomonas sp. ERG5]